jgi:hypothetical protein
MEFVGFVFEGFEWIHLAQDNDQWQDLLNTVMHFLGSISFL